MAMAEPMPYIKLVDCRNTVMLVHMNHRPQESARYERIDDETYRVVSTGEVRRYGEGSAVKGDCRKSVIQSFNRLKMLINANYDKPSCCRFVTLTYAANMTDNSRISRDLHKFWPRMHELYGDFEYIYVKEQQGRGAWHVHAVLFFERDAPFMLNADVAGAWGKGFVSVQGFDDNINNLGNYLCAYLTDGERNSKKGVRLDNYEAGIRLYNCSKGIRRPDVREVGYFEYADMVLSGGLVKLSDRETWVEVGGSSPLFVKRELYAVVR